MGGMVAEECIETDSKYSSLLRQTDTGIMSGNLEASQFDLWQTVSKRVEALNQRICLLLQLFGSTKFGMFNWQASLAPAHQCIRVTIGTCGLMWSPKYIVISASPPSPGCTCSCQVSKNCISSTSRVGSHVAWPVQWTLYNQDSFCQAFPGLVNGHFSGRHFSSDLPHFFKTVWI